MGYSYHYYNNNVAEGRTLHFRSDSETIESCIHPVESQAQKEIAPKWYFV